MFAAIDADGDGVITKYELNKAKAALITLDYDGDGTITSVEVPTGKQATSRAGGEPDFFEFLMSCDTDSNGKLVPIEIPYILVPLIARANQNGDYAVDRRELTEALANVQDGLPGGPAGRFVQFDSNGDGRLTRDEIPRECKSMLQFGDGNGAFDDGELMSFIGARTQNEFDAVAGGQGPNQINSWSRNRFGDQPVDPEWRQFIGTQPGSRGTNIPEVVRVPNLPPRAAPRSTNQPIIPRVQSAPAGR